MEEAELTRIWEWPLVVESCLGWQTVKRGRSGSILQPLGPESLGRRHQSPNEVTASWHLDFSPVRPWAQSPVTLFLDFRPEETGIINGYCFKPQQLICYEGIENEYSIILAVTSFAFPKGQPNNTPCHIPRLQAFRISLWRGRQGSRASRSSHGKCFLWPYGRTPGGQRADLCWHRALLLGKKPRLPLHGAGGSAKAGAR